MGHPRFYMVKAIPPSVLNATDAKIKEYLMSFDSNGDGKLSKQELKMAFQGLGSRSAWLRARLAIFRIDENHDGFISDQEINKLIEYIHQHGYRVP